MAVSSASLGYPSSGEYNVLVQRFKLLNLVQRVAHRDVGEMIDTVGLDCVARNGTLSRWMRIGEEEAEDGDEGSAQDGPPHHRTYGKYTAQRSDARWRTRKAAASRSSSRRVSPHQDTATPPPAALPPRMAFGRSTTGFEARVAAARWNSGMEEDSKAENHKHGVTRHVDASVRPSAGVDASEAARRRQYVVRRTQRVLRSSPSDREAFFARLAEPREHPEPVVEDVYVYDEDGEVGNQRTSLGRGRMAPPVGRAREQPTHDVYAAQRFPVAQSSSTRQPPQVLSSTVPPLNAFRRDLAPQPAYNMDDLRAHYHHYGTSPVYAPHRRSSASSQGTPSQPGEDRYDSDYPSARDERRRVGREEARTRYHEADGQYNEGDALPSALPPAPAQHKQQQQQQRATRMPLETGAAEEPNDMDFTPPPPSRPNAPARGAPVGTGVASSGDGAGRRRSVNFALGEEDEWGGTPTATGAPPLPGNYGVSSVRASAEEGLAATAPAAYAHARGHDEAGKAPAIPQLRFPLTGNGGGGAYGDGDDAAGVGGALNVPGSARGALTSPVSATNSPGGLRGRSGSGVAGFPKSPRVGRGLAPKAKPKAALGDSQVPVEAVRHAAALITRSNSTPASGMSPAASTPGNSYAATASSPAAGGGGSYGQRLSQQQQQSQVSSARTPPVTSAFSGGGILVSPRPNTVNVNAERQRLHVDGVASSFPDALVEARGSQPATPSANETFLPPSVATAADTALPINPGAQQSFLKVSSKVDGMLQNLQRVLQRVLKDGDTLSAGEVGGDRTKASPPLLAAPSSQPGDGAYTSSIEESVHDVHRAEHTIEVDLDTSNFDDDGSSSRGAVDVGDGEEEDEMLLYTRIQHRVSRLGEEMNNLAVPNSSSTDEGEWGSEARNAAAASREAESAQEGLSLAFSSSRPPARAQATQPAPRRVRGTLPDAVVQRLCAHRMEHFQYIAYNERLWNNSTTSQFVFAQRLTAALIEECWSEVMAEVDANMSEYVEGLIDHELQ